MTVLQPVVVVSLLKASGDSSGQYSSSSEQSDRIIIAATVEGGWEAVEDAIDFHPTHHHRSACISIQYWHWQLLHSGNGRCLQNIRPQETRSRIGGQGQRYDYMSHKGTHDIPLKPSMHSMFFKIISCFRSMQ